MLDCQLFPSAHLDKSPLPSHLGDSGVTASLNQLPPPNAVNPRLPKTFIVDFVFRHPYTSPESAPCRKHVFVYESPPGGAVRAVNHFRIRSAVQVG